MTQNKLFMQLLQYLPEWKNTNGLIQLNIKILYSIFFWNKLSIEHISVL